MHYSAGMMYTTLGRRIRDERERMDMSRAELARQVGVAASQITRWEAGLYMPAPSSLRLLARALGVELVDLVAAAYEDAL